MALFRKLNTEMNFATDRTVGEDHRYMKLQNAYREVLEKNVLAIENCYSGGEIQGDINLSALDCGKIVNEVFAEVFPVLEYILEDYDASLKYLNHLKKQYLPKQWVYYIFLYSILNKKRILARLHELNM